MDEREEEGLLAPKGRKWEFSIRAVDYELLKPIGDGATFVLCRARCLPLGNEVIAINIINMVHRTESDVVRTTLDSSLVIN